MAPTNSLAKLSVIGLFFCVSALAEIPALYGQSQSADCGKTIAAAEKLYRRGNFDDVISSLIQCVSSPGLSEQQTQQAYRLLGLAYLAKDYEKDAREAISKLLDIVPDYQPDPVQDPPTYTRLVEEIRKSAKTHTPKLRFAEKKHKKGGKKWWIIGGVGVAAGAVALLLGGGSSGGGQTAILSDPPDLPGN